MSKIEHDDRPSDRHGGELPSPTLADRLRVARDGDGYAYRPGRLVMRGSSSQLEQIRGIVGGDLERIISERDGMRTQVLTGVDNERAAIERLRAERFDVQPDHVLFAHGSCQDGCGPHPADMFEFLHGGAAGPFGADPWRANPWRANPYRANPWRANPWRANPFRANPNATGGTPTSTAEPATAPETAPRDRTAPGPRARIVVLDTGLADRNGQRPPFLAPPSGHSGAWRIDGTVDVPDAAIEGSYGVTHPPDGYLDPVAGHGTFIAGLIEQYAPGCTIDVRGVVAPLGDVTESDVTLALEEEIKGPTGDRPDIISMSFGGHLSEGSFALRESVAAAVEAGIVLVASAGNDGSCLPNYPAGFPGVVAVGALGPDGPAPWTNYGPWVDACAPGTDLVSSFFGSFDGKLPKINTVDPDRFRGWACWSGTSFAAPLVVAALARAMAAAPCTAAEAVDRVVHARHLLRIPCLGTVVNI
jgi:hypothetical protein